MAGDSGKSGKKRKAAAAAHAVVDDDPAAHPRYHPGPEFKEVKGSAMLDLSGVEDGSKELWLLQLPKPLTMGGLHGASLDLEASLAVDATGASIGAVSGKDGIKFSIVQESKHLSQQLFVVACDASKGSTEHRLCMLPLSKRITLDRVEEGPLPLPIMQAEAATARDVLESPADHTTPQKDTTMKTPPASKGKETGNIQQHEVEKEVKTETKEKKHKEKKEKKEKKEHKKDKKEKKEHKKDKKEKERKEKQKDT